MRSGIVFRIVLYCFPHRPFQADSCTRAVPAPLLAPATNF